MSLNEFKISVDNRKNYELIWYLKLCKQKIVPKNKAIN